MFCNFPKIVIKSSFFLFIFLRLTQDVSSMEDISLGSFDGSSFVSPKKPGNKLAETQTGYSPLKKKIKIEKIGASSFEDSEMESLMSALPTSEELAKEAAQGLRGLKLSELEALKVLILSGILHIEMRVDPLLNPYNPLMIPEKRHLELDYAKLPPNITNMICEFEQLGGNLNKLCESIQQLKYEYTSPIRNPSYRLGIAYTPGARYARVPRDVIEQGREDGSLQSLPVDFNIAPLTPETPEEREERKRQQLIDFLEMEKIRGKISEEEIAEILDQKGRKQSKGAIAEIKREIEIWHNHLNYINMRKKQLTIGKIELLDEDEFENDDDESFLCTGVEAGEEAKAGDLNIEQNGKVKKIRKAEIEDSFENFVAGKLACLEVEGYTLYFPKDLDLGREDINGLTNSERMAFGNCPIGADGEHTNIHHLTHHDRRTHKIESIVVMVTEYLHQTYSGSLHFGRNTYQDLPRRRVNRNEWNKVRPPFNQAIVKYLLSLPK